MVSELPSSADSRIRFTPRFLKRGALPVSDARLSQHLRPADAVSDYALKYLRNVVEGKVLAVNKLQLIPGSASYALTKRCKSDTGLRFEHV
jgi:hypothetical protein